VEAFDLAGSGRGAGFGVAGDDAVVAADPLEEHLTRAGLGEPAGELLAIVSQDFAGHPEPDQGVGERGTHGAAGCPAHHLRDDAEPGVVVQPGDHLGLRPVGEQDAADDVHLPQLHRLWPFPPQVFLPPPFARDGRNEVVAAQDPIHRGPGRWRGDAAAIHFEAQPSRSPAGMIPAQLAHQSLGVGVNPVRAVLRAVRSIL
jgi:hypothetical protein